MAAQMWWQKETVLSRWSVFAAILISRDPILSSPAYPVPPSITELYLVSVAAKRYTAWTTARASCSCEVLINTTTKG